MLTAYSRSQFVEKTLTDTSGRQFKVLFLVSLVNGEVVARPVSMKLISSDILALAGFQSDARACLACFSAARVEETPYVSPWAPVVSPYINLDAIITSQPTRAPSK